MMRVGILGASGFVGSCLMRLLAGAGHEAVGFSRQTRSGFRGIPAEGQLDFSGLDAVVNLAGEPILGLWTKDKRRRIVDSRVGGTRRIVESMASFPEVGVLINASAIGFYGDTGENSVDEASAPGQGFLAETCRAWEAECERVPPSVREVRIRIGFVLGDGGAMKFVLPLFRAGLGGRLGNGTQWMSCVHVDDVAGLILWALENPTVRGAVNAVMPEPVRNSEFTRAVARAVHRPALFPAPGFILRNLLGGVSCVMLDNARVLPMAALQGGYPYRYADLDSAIQSLVKPK